MSLLGSNLEAFIAITRTKTVLAASKVLGITQTGVTQRIRSLENQLETTLFTRSRQGMRLTYEGESLLRYCQTVKELEGEVTAKMKGAGKTSEVRISILGPTSIMRTRVIPGTLTTMKAFPEILASFEISDSRSGAEALRTGAVQFAVVPPEEVAREMDSKVLQSENYVLVGTRKWKNRSLKEIVSTEKIIDFDASDSMTHAYLKKYKLLPYAKSERHFVNNNESLLEMFQQGVGYGVLTKEFADTYVKHYDVVVLSQEQYLENRLALAWYPRPKKSEYFEAIIKAIR